MSALYFVAGVSHFRRPKMYERIVPPQFPRPRELVYLSGVVELLLALGLLSRRTRRQSAWGIVALLLAVFPANVYMATHDVLGDAVPEERKRAVDVALWLRLPLQGVLVAWAWWYTRSSEATD
jgi:uncharacterized membrane protein